MSVNQVFRALADPTRREVLRLLGSGDMTAGEIGRRFPLAASTLSGHFNVLKHAGLIVAERRGTTLVYRLNGSAAEESLRALVEIVVGSGPAKGQSGPR